MLEKLTALPDALAADGVLRHMVAFVHPDTIIAFADGVAEAVADAVCGIRCNADSDSTARGTAIR